GAMQDVIVRNVPANEPVIRRVQFLEAVRPYQEAIYEIRELIPGGPVDRPVVPQRLLASQYFLRQHVERQLGGTLSEVRWHYAGALLQGPKVPARVEQTVGMVDADALQLPVLDQLQDQPVRRLENLGIFHAQRRQFVDVEKAAIVDLVGCNTPVREAIRLRLEQLVQPC